MNSDVWRKHTPFERDGCCMGTQGALVSTGKMVDDVVIE